MGEYTPIGFECFTCQTRMVRSLRNVVAAGAPLCIVCETDTEVIGPFISPAVADDWKHRR